MQFILIVLLLTFAEVVMLTGHFPQEFLTDLFLKSWDLLEKGSDLLKQVFLLFYN